MDNIRTKLHHCFHNAATKEARIINGLFSFLILFSIAVIPLHFIAKLPDYAWISDTLFLVDKITVTLFTLEYALRIWSDKNSTRFILSWEGMVDLIAILPFYVSKFGGFSSSYVEVFMLLRILRILKFTVMYGQEHDALERCKSSRHGQLYILPNEKVERIIQKHPIVFLVALLFPLIFMSAGLAILIFSNGSANVAWWSALAVLCFALAATFFYKAWLDYQYDVIYITNYRVILQNHELFGSETNGLTYDSITNVVPSNKGFFRWVFGFGHIEIETANRDATIVFKNAVDPHRVVKQISANRLMGKREATTE